MAKRHQHLEHAILTFVLRYGDHQGYAATLPQLAAMLRETFAETFADVDQRELVDTLKRLSPRYLTLWKYSDAHHRFVQYPDEISDDEQFFYRADFRLRRTPHSDPLMQTLALEISQPSMTPTIDEAGRKSVFARLEQLGLDRVKADLVHTGGRREVGGALDVRELAWEWVRMKEADLALASKLPKAGPGFSLISESRLEELRAIRSTQFDFRKLVRLCEEINTAFSGDCFFAAAMLTRGLLDHVPPVFGKTSFAEVANNYGAKSFKEPMQHLENASRAVADGYLHQQIRQKEALPTAQQVSCGQQLDVLLAEIVRIAR